MTHGNRGLCNTTTLSCDAEARQLSQVFCFGGKDSSIVEWQVMLLLRQDAHNVGTRAIVCVGIGRNLPGADPVGHGHFRSLSQGPLGAPPGEGLGTLQAREGWSPMGVARRHGQLRCGF